MNTIKGVVVQNIAFVDNKPEFIVTIYTRVCYRLSGCKLHRLCKLAGFQVKHKNAFIPEGYIHHFLPCCNQVFNCSHTVKLFPATYYSLLGIHRINHAFAGSQPK